MRRSKRQPVRTVGGESRASASIGAADWSTTGAATSSASAGSSRTSSSSSLPSQQNPGPSNVLKFQRPRSSVAAEIGAAATEQFIFPPTLFTDATYSRGPLVPNTDDNDGAVQPENGGYGRDRRVARDFRGAVYLGTITDYNRYDNDERWHVRYDDGDEEDFDRKELDGAIALYRQLKRGDDEDDESNDDRCAISNVEIELPYDYFGPDNRNVKCKDLVYGYGGCISGAFSSTGRYATCTGSSSSSGDNVRLLPALTPEEAKIWTHKHAAHAAAHRRFPSQAVRLLGTITLYFDEKCESRTSMDTKKKKKKGCARTQDDVGLFAQSSEHCNKYRCHYVSRSGIPRKPGSNYVKFNRNITPKQAMVEAMAEMNIEDGTDPAVLSSEVQAQLEVRAEQIIQFWKGVRGSPPLRECWNQKDGAFVREALEASKTSDDAGADADADAEIERYVPVSVILEWVKNDGRHPNGAMVTDRSEGRTVSLYSGLRHIPTDAVSILEALMDLSCPSSLYKVPLITPVATARIIEDEDEDEGEGSVKGARTWKVRVGVYMNRLLPEVLTESTLHTVMSALDEGSYIVSEQLHTPPMRGINDPVFQSSKYPIVSLGGSDDTRTDDNIATLGGDDDMSLEEGEEKKEDDGEIMDAPKGDVAMLGSTRESSIISPFTTKGFLKLIENTGNEDSAWPDIAGSLSPYLELELMLHQRHAVCWMAQMEALGGFGLNSIIWEERQFLDGGKFYYSPALGQIKLSKPPTTCGGILADSMGLGKTLEMLCVIAASLDDLKKEAKDDGEYCTHATLIIVPPALVVQWMKEIKKACGETLKVAFLDARTREVDESIAQSCGKGTDILITTYGALETAHTSKYLAKFRWGRIVLDEMQEIRSSTTKIARNCESLVCHRRWMMSGTPIFDGIEDLKGELNFLRLDPYAAKWEDGFFDFSILNHWKLHSRHGLETLRVLGLLMLRRSKDMTIRQTGRSIMDQKELTVEFVPVPQVASERALYCWMEYVVSQELNQKEEDARDLKSRNLCLRLLREICFSVVLLNGGLGVSSQARTLNALMVKANRRAMSDELDGDRRGADDGGHRSRKKRESTRVVGCDEALRFLTQVQKDANVREDFVTDVRMGRGQGVTNRNHAMDSVEDQVKQAQKEVDAATKEQVDARRKRAKAHWHHALELVTMGVLWNDHNECGVSPKVSSLWKWRYLCAKLDEDVENETKRKCSLPQFLGRGWRPNPSFLKEVRHSNPSFAWSYPSSLRLDNIPAQVVPEDLETALFDAAAFEAEKKENQATSRLEALSKMLENSHDTSSSNRDQLRDQVIDAETKKDNAIARSKRLSPPKVVKITTSSNTEYAGTWKAFVILSAKEDLQLLTRQAASTAGIGLESKEPVPHIQTAIEKAVEEYNQAESENKVYPCSANKKRQTLARKALDKAKLGLRIKSDNSSTGSVILSRAMNTLRSMAPRSGLAQIESCTQAICQTSNTLERVASRLDSGRRTLARLMPALESGVAEDVTQMSAFDTLEALRELRMEKTQCPICLSPFGSSAASASSSEPVVAMLSCGHFFCIECLEGYARRRIADSRTVKCPNCRRGFCLSSDVMHIDHTRDDSEYHQTQRELARQKVREASDMLESSNGIIDGELWKSLYLSIDVPAHASTRAHPIHTALPRDVLGHIRASCAMKVDCSQSESPSSSGGVTAHGLSSKIQALLRDLPLGEHAVVFTSSRNGVLHLRAVMQNKAVKCCSLYTGQNAKATEEAVSSWENAELDPTKAGPVLVVQAGAAASGLTLTSASKLFLMEPFPRQEEEQQAYARCHRYGQKKDVNVKVYYAPVSVESRLLEWRKKAAKEVTTGGTSNSTNYVFAPLFDDEGNDDSDSEDEVASEDEPDSGGEEEKGNSNQEDAQTDEDNRRTRFLLGLIDADGNPIGVEDDGDETEENK